MTKLTRAQSIAVAQQARKVRDGENSKQYQVRLPTDIARRFEGMTPIERGDLIKIGDAMTVDGYLMLYDIIDRLGVRILSTVLGKPTMIICRHKTYEGEKQLDLLLEIIRDRLANYNMLSPVPGDFDNTGELRNVFED